MSLSPVALFVYNRPEHTKKTLESLTHNPEIKDSILYIFADGPRENASQLDFKHIEKTREICKRFNFAKEVKIIFRENNCGLAENIINGVTSILNEYGKVIVLEDDLYLSPKFLGYMNSALDFYKDNDKVMHISGYWFPTPNYKNLPDNYFLHLGSCWGWATWKRAWDKIERDPLVLKNKIKEVDPTFKDFTLDGSSDFLRQLDNNINGSLKTWAIKWYSTIFINGGLSLHPNHSYVNNIGFDGSGDNCGINHEFYWQGLNENEFSPSSKIEYCKKAEMDLIRFYNNRKGKFSIIKSFVKKLIPFNKRQKIKRKLRQFRDYLKYRKFKKIWKEQRFLGGVTKFNNKDLYYVDGASLYFMIKEIFNVEIYKFNLNHQNPYILDCGANIGLASIYLAQRFPTSEIICFEPDKKVANVLKNNIASYCIEKNVEVVEKGLWSEETTLEFFAEGAAGGRVKIGTDDKNIIKIEVVKLSDYITKRVDFLKIDIEGAEFEVLKEIEPKLDLIDRIFIEYHSFVGQEQSLTEIISILKSAGFRLNINTPGLKSDSPFFQIKESNGMDMQLNIYAFKN